MSEQQAVMHWSGGKDSALALYHSLRAEQCNVRGLLTAVNTLHQRVSMHGVRAELIHAQAERLGLPLHLLSLPGDVTMEAYNARMQTALESFRDQHVTHAIFGDIFLEDLRQYREGQLRQAGLTGVFPIWQRDSTELVREFIDLGFRAVLVCVNEKQLDPEFLGRELTLDLLRDLPKSVDPCGENGEYHSFVFDGPIFAAPVPFTKGEIVRRTYIPSTGSDCHTAEPAQQWDTGFWYMDLL